ncbi:hypothetical protein GCM10009090_06130 [[Pseudomonas] boreopolis]|uniref:Uncharacterized protein n=1 Tax=Xanthomonas boreopolis TaxID=86183 RepID=A0A919F655_9XANT|nr:hypothetical protein GCM10009090_06130 [[Pseudomonas] boreopolis]
MEALLLETADMGARAAGANGERRNPLFQKRRAGAGRLPPAAGAAAYDQSGSGRHAGGIDRPAAGGEP